MILTGPEIVKQRALGNIVIEPFDPACAGANSYDLRLDKRLLVYRDDHDLAEEGHGVESVHLRSRKLFDPDNHGIVVRVLDMKKNNPVREIDIPSEGLILMPETLYIGSTVEYTETPGFVPSIEGRSSVARLGLQVHVTAGFGDQNFKGTWTLEMTTVHPLRVYAGVRICQISYAVVMGDPKPYTGKYQGQRGPQPSRLWKDFVK